MPCTSVAVIEWRFLLFVIDAFPEELQVGLPGGEVAPGEVGVGRPLRMRAVWSELILA
jgi:hypothetical protein